MKYLRSCVIKNIFTNYGSIKWTLKFINFLSRSFLFIFLIIINIVAISYHFDGILLNSVNAEEFDSNDNSKKEKSMNQTKLSNSYKMLVDNDFPFPVYFADKIISKPVIVYDGIAFSSNSEHEKVIFSEWGVPNNLNLYSIDIPDENISLFEIEGSTLDSPAGFLSSFLNYTDRYLSLNFGNIIKYPVTAQVSIQLDIIGKKDDYHILLVNGRLQYENWVDNYLYKSITSNSSQLIDLVELVSTRDDEFVYLDRISVNVEKATEIISFPFRMDFGRTTMNTPNILFENDPYFINGFIFEGKVISNDYRFLFDNWKYKQILSQQFIVDSSNHHWIAPNGWDIKEVNRTKDNLTNQLNIRVESEKNIPLTDISFLKVFSHFDLYESLLLFGDAKDILFIILLILLFISAYQVSGKNISITTNRKNKQN